LAKKGSSEPSGSDSESDEEKKNLKRVERSARAKRKAAAKKAKQKGRGEIADALNSDLASGALVLFRGPPLLMTVHLLRVILP